MNVHIQLICLEIRYVRYLYHSYTGQLVVDQIGGLMSHLFGNHL